MIAQVQVPEDTGEITQVPTLLDPVDLTNVVVTADAAHAQHTTATYLTEQRGGHYVLTVKGNQPTPLTAITATFPLTPAGSEHYVHEERIKAPDRAPSDLGRPRHHPSTSPTPNRSSGSAAMCST
ncbi:MAG: transposase [Pseudonocardia sp.]|nr:transposase [Pseudonocardia sp.]